MLAGPPIGAQMPYAGTSQSMGSCEAFRACMLLHQTGLCLVGCVTAELVCNLHWKKCSCLLLLCCCTAVSGTAGLCYETTILHQSICPTLPCRCDPFSQVVFDYTGGLADCSKRLVRTIGPAETSLRHDPIRMLRAVRFCSTSGEGRQHLQAELCLQSNAAPHCAAHLLLD